MYFQVDSLSNGRLYNILPSDTTVHRIDEFDEIEDSGVYVMMEQDGENVYTLTSYHAAITDNYYTSEPWMGKHVTNLTITGVGYKHFINLETGCTRYGDEYLYYNHEEG